MTLKAKQREANTLDLEVFRLVRQLYGFAHRHNVEDVARMAQQLDMKRNVVRQYMSEKDLNDTPL